MTSKGRWLTSISKAAFDVQGERRGGLGVGGGGRQGATDLIRLIDLQGRTSGRSGRSCWSPSKCGSRGTRQGRGCTGSPCSEASHRPPSDRRSHGWSYNSWSAWRCPCSHCCTPSDGPGSCGPRRRLSWRGEREAFITHVTCCSMPGRTVGDTALPWTNPITFSWFLQVHKPLRCSVYYFQFLAGENQGNWSNCIQLTFYLKYNSSCARCQLLKFKEPEIAAVIQTQWICHLWIPRNRWSPQTLPFQTPICVFSVSKIRPLAVRSLFSSSYFYSNEFSRCLSFPVTLFDTCSQTIFSLHLFVKPVTILHVSSYLSHGCRLVDVLRIDLDTLAGPFILSHWRWGLWHVRDYYSLPFRDAN